MELGRTVLDQVRPGDVEPVGVLDPILRFDAREPGQRIADFPEHPAGGLVVQGAEVALVEQAAQPEGADAPVDAVRLVQIEGSAAEVVEQVAEARAGERRHEQIQLVVAQRVAEDEDGALRGPDPRRHHRVPRREIE